MVSGHGQNALSEILVLNPKEELLPFAALNTIRLPSWRVPSAARHPDLDLVEEKRHVRLFTTGVMWGTADSYRILQVIQYWVSCSELRSVYSDTAYLNYRYMIVV